MPHFEMMIKSQHCISRARSSSGLRYDLTCGSLNRGITAWSAGRRVPRTWSRRHRLKAFAASVRDTPRTCRSSLGSSYQTEPYEHNETAAARGLGVKNEARYSGFESFMSRRQLRGLSVRGELSTESEPKCLVRAVYFRLRCDGDIRE